VVVVAVLEFLGLVLMGQVVRLVVVEVTALLVTAAPAALTGSELLPELTEGEEGPEDNNSSVV
jgi:hypothetical protein